MFFDGSLMKTGAGAGLLFISPLGKHLRYVLRLHFQASNNVAEYEALVNGLRIAIELGSDASTLAVTCSSSSTKS
jgi:ribonuclease HI